MDSVQPFAVNEDDRELTLSFFFFTLVTQYRSLIKSSQPVYLVSSKKEKTAISRSIVSAVRRVNGRFLERTRDMKYYYDIGDAKAIEKTSQALREGQPKLRKRMMTDGVVATAKIKPSPMPIRNVSYSSMELINMQRAKINRQQSMLGQVMNSSLPTVNDRWLHQTNDCNQLLLPINRTVTPPCTPPTQIDRKLVRDKMLGCALPSLDIDANDFDDDNSIKTFDMDADEMIDNDEDDIDAKSTFPTPTPSQSLPSQFPTMNELKSNLPAYNNRGGQRIFPRMVSTTSPFINHLRALTELKDHVPKYPSTASFRDLRFDFSKEIGANFSRSTLNATFPSIPNPTI